MARKRFLLFSAIQPILKHRFAKKEYKFTSFDKIKQRFFAPLRLCVRQIHTLNQQHRKTHLQNIAIFLAFFTLISTLISPVLGRQVIAKETQHPQTFLISQASYALELEQKGKDSYDIGRFAEAAKFWQQAADAYGENDRDNKNKNIINKTKALQSLGLYPEACSQLIQVFTSANLTCEQLINNSNAQTKLLQDIEAKQNSPNKIIGLRLFGEFLQRLGDLKLSPKVLQISLKASKEYPEEKSATLLTLGNIERAIGNKNRDSLDYEKIVNIIKDKDFDKALKIYQPAFNYYQAAATSKSPIITQFQAVMNQLSLIVEMKEWWAEQISKSKENWTQLQDELSNRVKNFLPKIKFHLSKLPQSREAVSAQINFTYTLIRLKSITNQDYFSLPAIAKLLSNAILQARSLGDKQAEAEALSHLASLYELQVSRTENLTEQDKLNLIQAKNLTQQALRLSDNINIDNRQVLYRQRHQLGRILKAEGNIEAALASYAEAWNILQSLREDLVTNNDNQFSFRQNVEPVYREFIDLLLQPKSSKVDFKKLVLRKDIRGAENLGEEYKYQNIEDIARLVMESLQLAELDNFFQEPCSPPVAKPVQIDKIDQKAAVIYPIILENRLEVILSQNGKSSHYSTKVTKKEVNNTLRDLANIIYNKVVEKDSAINIILTPKYEGRKSELDSNQQKIEQLSQKVYDWLIRPLELDQQIETLVFVLDRSFQKIPIAALYDGKNKKYLVENYNLVLNLGQQLKKEPKPLTPENINILAAGVSEERYEREQNFPELKNVEKELMSIENLRVPTKKILNQEFNQRNFQKGMKSLPTVVHLATHGVFSSNREQTFILTGDRSIGIDDFQNLLNPNKDKITNRTIQLLVLSACETALGDDRAALGMAGVVLRSGASSTVASLWPVSDPATALLMEEFYKNLVTLNQKRAQALRNAQRFLLMKSEYNHPFYWAPFVLVGNWN
ncbi:MAG: CHAT domain-containing protein [Stigonema ocellatum SAG 48.90 = DSM 106950]|nr:CHAT domain-containing protein [Stigonema ocellatum SAG 48.90 = DSM 106950]